jgi:hypothetical protein
VRYKVSEVRDELVKDPDFKRSIVGYNEGQINQLIRMVLAASGRVVARKLQEEEGRRAL